MHAESTFIKFKRKKSIRWAAFFFWQFLKIQCTSFDFILLQWPIEKDERRISLVRAQNFATQAMSWCTSHWESVFRDFVFNQPLVSDQSALQRDFCFPKRSLKRNRRSIFLNSISICDRWWPITDMSFDRFFGFFSSRDFPRSDSDDHRKKRSHESQLMIAQRSC